ncbi:MAG: protein kinase [Fuerstiella sp.]
MRKPSENLTRQLKQLNLCSLRELMACEKQVDRLSDGLPDFDSVWLDVLVQRQVISRFQANLVQQGKPNELKLESLILREQLGERSFLAMTQSDQPIVVQQRNIATDGELKSLSTTIAALHAQAKSAPSCLTVPIRLATKGDEESDRKVFVANHFQQGWTLAELLVRGGRLPWQGVLHICQQTLRALQWLHSQECCHGNLNTHNIQVTAEGKVVVVGALASRFTDGGISLSANLTYDEARFMAPERTLNLQPANFQSDLYSLAAVLWNLLAARDAFLTTDPISRITKAGQENLPDIRSLVPDCPADFALAIQRFSKSNPQLRPANPTEAIDLIKPVGSGSRHGLRSLVRTLPDRATTSLPVRRNASHSNILVTAAVACLMIMAFTAYGIQRGLIPSVASLTAPAADLDANSKPTADIVTAQRNSGQSQPTDSHDPHRILSLPSPDIAGVVVLVSGRKYRASDLHFPGVMHVETTGQESAQVIVAKQQTWNLDSRQLTLSNVHVVHQNTSLSTTESDSRHGPEAISESSNQATRFATAVHATADVVSIQKCIIESSLNEQQAVCLHWSESTGTTSTLQIQDCVFKSDGAALSTSIAPQRCVLRNCLMLVKRSVLRATVPASMSAPWPLTIHRITQPTGLTFADFLIPDQSATACQVNMTAGESVLNPTLALVQFASRNESAASQSRIEFQLPERGNAIIVPPRITSAVAWDQSLKSVVELAPDHVYSGAILSAEPRFRGQVSPKQGQPSSPWQAFELIDYEGPKLTTKLPGIQIATLPNLMFTRKPVRQSAARMNSN